MLTKNEIKHIRLLEDKKHRTEQGLFVAEGQKWVEELLINRPDWLHKIYACRQWIDAHRHTCPTHLLEEVTPFEMKKISMLQTPTQVLALAHLPQSAQSGFAPNSWNLVLDGIQDPGNLGSIIRTADWFGLTQIWCSTDTADAWQPKVVQASMGSLCRVAIHYTPDLKVLLTRTPQPVYPTAMAGVSIFSQSLPPGIIIIGNEGKGVRPHLAALATYPITIPRLGHAESLNAAVATGIILSRLLMQ
jgi:TrmH family RNA methyltransferase